MATPVQIPTARGIVVDTTGAEIVMEDSPSTRDSRGIYLPHYIEPVSHIAIDIGGSLAKVVYFTRSPNPPAGHSKVQGIKRKASSSRQGGTDPAGSVFSTSAPCDLNGDTESLPVVNGALTPQMLSADRELALGPSSPPSAEALTQAMQRTSTTHTRIQSNSRPGRSHSLMRRGSLPPNFPGGVLNFVRFETEQIPKMIAFLQSLISLSASVNHVSEEQMKSQIKIMATGGGAHKYYDILRSELGVEVSREDEMECLITGLRFITSIPDEVFWYSDELVYEISHPPKDADAPPHRIDNGSSSESSEDHDRKALPRPSPDPPMYQVTFDTSGTPQFPCLLVNIGSGVSIVKVDEDGSFERVSGTSVGGGTLWGLLSLITDANSFDEMLALSEKGDNSVVDMLVGDIYGADYSKVGLKSSTIASSFGKVFKKGAGANSGERRKNFRQEDISRSLLYAVSNNIGQIAYMNAEKYGLDRIYFGGCFIRGHAATISTLSYAIRFWSRGTVRAMFLRHEGFLGSIGAWIKNVNARPETAAVTDGDATPTA